MVQFIPAREMKRIPEPSTGGQHELQDIYDITASHAERLGVDKDVAFKNMMNFVDTVGLLENDGKLEGGNRPQKGKEASTAKGLYQYLDGSVPPAMERLRRHVDYDWVKDDANPNDLTWNQQTMMMVADILEKKGSDKLMKKVLESGDTESIKNAYYELHHTKPDEATKKRTKTIMTKGLRGYQEEVKGLT